MDGEQRIHPTLIEVGVFCGVFDKEWESLLQKKMESINFSIDNPMWRDMGMKSNYDMNKTTREKLYKLFREDVN